FVALGVQLIERHEVWDHFEDARKGQNCGALQRPVLTSSFGADLGLDVICRGRQTPLDSLAKAVAQHFWLLRYRSAVKSLLVPGISDSRLQFNSAKIGYGFRGFEPHATIAARPNEFEEEFARWRKQFEGRPEAFDPLPHKIWEQMVGNGGFFDKMVEGIRSVGAEPIFFALPTNPRVIDTFRRRADYSRNSALLARWSADRSVIFIDLGIQDRGDAAQYFSDVRHLSYVGAENFSRRLGRAIAAHPLLREHYHDYSFEHPS
ncbi:MAG: hypothetical protein ACREX9_21910, partial [Gammaproteobacteria bacterium]